MDRFKKTCLLSQLINVVEAMHVEREFCDELEQRILTYRTHNPFSGKLLIFGNGNDADAMNMRLDRFHFTEAIAYLDKYMHSDVVVYNIAKDVYSKFEVQRTHMCDHMANIQLQFYQMLDKLVPLDNRPGIKYIMRRKLHPFEFIMHQMVMFHRDIQRKDISENGLIQIIELTKKLAAKLCILLPHPVLSIKRWMLIRNELMYKSSPRINQYLNEILKDVHRHKLRIRHKLSQQRSVEQCGHQIEELLFRTAQIPRPLTPFQVPLEVVVEEEKDNDNPERTQSKNLIRYRRRAATRR